MDATARPAGEQAIVDATEQGAWALSE